jgi:hypothetical protein
VPTPQQLAQAYDRHLADRWRRKDEPPGDFEHWLEAHWRPDGEPEPGRRPDGRSTLGGSDNGLRIYREGESLLGFLSGRPAGCYRISVGEVIPSAPRERVHEGIRQKGSS